MKIVFFGTSRFAADLLSFLLQEEGSPHEIVAVVTRPDRPQGRELHLGMSPVKQLMRQENPCIPLLQPDKASTEVFCEELRRLQPDLFLVVAYGEILQQNILSIPRKACINIHASLLPKYRGAAPMQRCLMAGEKVSGVTFMEMALRMDAGDILLQEEVEIPPEMNVAGLETSLLEASKKRLPEFLQHFDEYFVKKQIQEEHLATFASKITAEDSLIHWDLPAETIHNQIRGLSPSPGAYVNLAWGSQMKRLKLLKSEVCLNCPVDPQCSAGKCLLDSSALFISCGTGWIKVLEVQLEGKKAMPIKEFLSGAPKHLSLIPS